MVRYRLFARVAVFLLVPAFSVASPPVASSTVKVLHTDSHALQVVANDGTHCNAEDLDGYCQDINPASVVENVMDVQQSDGSLARISCTTEGISSNCTVLPINQSVPAKFGKHAVELQYVDAANKPHKQIYRFVEESQKLAAGE